MANEVPRKCRTTVLFARVPISLLERCHDSGAIHLYALLAKHADHDLATWDCSLKSLSREMGVSERTVARKLDVLRALMEVETDLRHAENGGVTGLHFRLVNLARV